MLASDGNRFTVVVSRPPRHSWNRTGVLLVDSLPQLAAVANEHDVERIVIDRCATPYEFLHFLAALPLDSVGDVLSVGDDGGAFLSALGRGGDRVLYALAPGDVDFYLRTTVLPVPDETSR